MRGSLGGLSGRLGWHHGRESLLYEHLGDVWGRCVIAHAQPGNGGRRTCVHCISSLPPVCYSPSSLIGGFRCGAWATHHGLHVVPACDLYERRAVGYRWEAQTRARRQFTWNISRCYYVVFRFGTNYLEGESLRGTSGSYLEAGLLIVTRVEIQGSYRFLLAKYVGTHGGLGSLGD